MLFSKIGRLSKNGRVGEGRNQRYIVEQTKLFCIATRHPSEHVK